MANSHGAMDQPPNLGGPQRGFQTADVTNPPWQQQSRPITLTSEEIRVLRECNRESFWSRSLPASMICVGITRYLIGTGFIKPHPKYGAVLKSIGAAAAGYILGKLSYQNMCRQKIMALSNSQLADRLRQRDPRGSVATPLPPASEFSMETPSTETDKLIGQTEQEALDTFKPLEDDSGDPKQAYTSYSELRRKNRAAFYENQNQRLNLPSPPKQVENQPSRSSSTSEIPEVESRSEWRPSQSSTDKNRMKKNQYGDVWEE